MTKTKALVPALGEDDALISGAMAGMMLGDASRRKLRDLVARGEFLSYPLDGKTVYSKREILAFIARLKARGPGRAPWRGRPSHLRRARPRRGGRR